jgi:hypothetical protein
MCRPESSSAISLCSVPRAPEVAKSATFIAGSMTDFLHTRVLTTSITTAGVCSGFDARLHLSRREFGDRVAQAIQLGIRIAAPVRDAEPWVGCR